MKTQTNIAKTSSFKNKFVIGLIGAALFIIPTYLYKFKANQQVSQQVKNQGTSIEELATKLFSVKNTDEKEELSLVVSLQAQMTSAANSLKAGNLSNPDTANALQITNKGLEALKMIESGILKKDKVMKDKGYTLFEGVMYSN